MSKKYKGFKSEYNSSKQKLSRKDRQNLCNALTKMMILSTYGYGKVLNEKMEENKNEKIYGNDAH